MEKCYLVDNKLVWLYAKQLSHYQYMRYQLGYTLAGPSNVKNKTEQL